MDPTPEAEITRAVQASTLLPKYGEAVDRERLATDVLTADLSPRPRTVDSHASRLRRKLGQAASGAEALVQTLRGEGYRFDAEVQVL